MIDKILDVARDLGHEYIMYLNVSYIIGWSGWIAFLLLVLYALRKVFYLVELDKQNDVEKEKIRYGNR